MKKMRYFRSINRLNIIIDFITGNFLPLSNKGGLGAICIIWMTIAWSLKIIFLASMILGTLHFAKLTVEEIFQKIGAIGVGSVEFLVLAFHLNLQRGNLRELVKKYNELLIDSDLLRKYIRETLKTYNTGLILYLIGGSFASLFFSLSPISKIFYQDQFTYVDYTIPIYLPGEPFDKSTFVAGLVFEIIGSLAIHIGMVSVYFYAVHYFAVLAGQFKFVRWQMTEALSDEDESKSESAVIDALKKSIDYHVGVIEVGKTLTRIMQFYVGATYITCVMEFCFLTFGIITFESAPIEKIAYVGYIAGRVVLVFMLCSSVQELLDSSTAIMDDAFHQNWYGRSKAVQKMCYMIQLGNNIECRITAWKIVDLIVPTLANMLSKSYSVCLLLLSV